MTPWRNWPRRSGLESWHDGRASGSSGCSARQAISFRLRRAQLARCAWLGSTAVFAGRGDFSVCFCYLQTMKKTVEQPDLEQTRGHRRSLLPLGDQLQTAIVRFSMRSLARKPPAPGGLCFLPGDRICYCRFDTDESGNEPPHGTGNARVSREHSHDDVSCCSGSGAASSRFPFFVKSELGASRWTQLSSPEHYIAATPTRNAGPGNDSRLVDGGQVLRFAIGLGSRCWSTC